MTIGMAWIATRRDGRQHLYLAADSRVTGGLALDVCPKIFPLPRSDCALCFAGTTAAAFPLMLHAGHAIAAHQPARERSIDLVRLKDHLVRVLTDVIRSADAAWELASNEAQFLLGGYSGLRKDFCIWTFSYSTREKGFVVRESRSFHVRLSKAAFIGDWSRRVRGEVVRKLSADGGPAWLEPLDVLAGLLRSPEPGATIGGAPQVLRVSQNMNTRLLCVRWKGSDTLLGRPLFENENTDNWIIDPFTGRLAYPRKFGRRMSSGAPSTAASSEPEEGDEVDPEA